MVMLDTKLSTRKIPKKLFHYKLLSLLFKNTNYRKMFKKNVIMYLM